jgi:ribosomal protein L31E
MVEYEKKNDEKKDVDNVKTDTAKVEATQKVDKGDTKKQEAKPSKPKTTKKKLPEEIHTINLRKAYEKPTTKRVKAAMNIIRDYVFKHKRKEARIDPELVKIIQMRGRSKPAPNVKVKLVIGDVVEVKPVE